MKTNPYRQLFEDKVSGVLSSEVFKASISDLEDERAIVANRLYYLNQTHYETEVKPADIDKWALLIKEKSTLDDVDRDLLETLVERIEIGERIIQDGELTQDIRIFYKYVGLC